jgi:hypothetical protein
MQFEFSRKRAEEYLRRQKQLEAQQTQERRIGREKGQLSQSLREKLRACNVLQLRKVKKLCDSYIQDQKLPPDPSECRKPFTVDVLGDVSIRNKRYQLELRRTTHRGKKVYLQGPYVLSYWRDGRIIKSHYFGNRNWSRIPIKARKPLKELFDTYVDEHLHNTQ